MDLSSTTFSNWFLKPFTLLASATSCGKEVHSVITCFIKKYILLFKASAQSFHSSSLAFVLQDTTNNSSLSTSTPHRAYIPHLRYLLSSFSSRLKGLVCSATFHIEAAPCPCPPLHPTPITPRVLVHQMGHTFLAPPFSSGPKKTFSAQCGGRSLWSNPLQR